MTELLHPGHRTSLIEFEQLLPGMFDEFLQRVGAPAALLQLNWQEAAQWVAHAVLLKRAGHVLPQASPDGSDLWWQRRLELQTGRESRGIGVPWLIDPHENEAFTSESGLTLEGKLNLGGHEGLYVGGPRIPVIQARLRPGLRVLANYSTQQPDLVAVLVPDVGHVRHVVLAGSRSKKYQYARESIHHALLGTNSTRYLSPETKNSVWTQLGLEGGTASPDDFAELLEAWLRVNATVTSTSRTEEPTTATGAEKSRLCFWGDHLATAVLRGLRRAEGLLVAGRRPDARTVLDTTAWALTNSMKELALGQSEMSGLVRLPRDTDTLSRIEQYREVTFFGAGGLPELRNRLDLRDLDPGWRGVLCPLQTPESTKVGLIRYLAASEHLDDGDAGAYGDVSASACLIPFLDHNEPAKASTGSKNLKQAVAVWGAEPPRVRTGWEQRLAELAGVRRSPGTGTLEKFSGTQATLARGGDEAMTTSFGPAWTGTAGPARHWMQATADADLQKGDLLAHAPDVVVGEGDQGLLALGVNAMVALMPWHGLNYEDGIVVSTSFAARLGSTHTLVITERFSSETDNPPVDVITGLGGLHEWQPAGAPAVSITQKDGRKRVVTLPFAGIYRGMEWTVDSVLVRLEVERRLEVGDKLTNRHGGKGVICAILPDEEMPRLPDGRGVDAILNPLGVLRRLNIGQLWEMHTALAAYLAGEGAVQVGRRVDNPVALGQELAALGAPNGRLDLVMADGRALGSVVVGEQYLLKLNHLAADKAKGVGADSPRSPRTLQPLQRTLWREGKQFASAQRMGEMEVWALQALGARHLLHDLMAVRGLAGLGHDVGKVKPTLRALDALLGVAGMQLVATLKDGSQSTDVFELDPASVVDLDVSSGARSLPCLNDTELGHVAACLPDTPEHTHPLYDARHGEADSLDREKLRWTIDLPLPVAHPWASGVERPLPELTTLPLLPPSLRAGRREQLDPGYAGVARYAALLKNLLLRQKRNEAELAALGQAEATSAMSRLEIEAEARRRTLKAKQGGLANDIDLAHQALTLAVEAVLGTAPKYGELKGKLNGVRRLPTGSLAEPHSSIYGRLDGKDGLLRRWLLGHAAQRSGRAVITGEPLRPPQTVGVPARVFDAIVGNGDDAHADVVLVSRQPTLRPNAMLALRAERVPGNAILLNPAVLDCLAGDFDGDTAAVHWPATPAARREAWQLMRPARQIQDLANGGRLAKLDFDVALGVHLASGTKEGRARLASELHLTVTGPLSQKDLIAHATALLNALDEDAQVDWLAKALRFGCREATGWSIGALDLVGAFEEASDEWKEKTTGAQGVVLLAQARAAGAAGNDDGLEQLLVRRGAVLSGRKGVLGGDPKKVLRLPDVDSGFLTGLTPEEMFATAPGGIYGLAEKKLITPTAGDFTKMLVEVGYEVRTGGDECASTSAERSPLSCEFEPPVVCRACLTRVERLTGTVADSAIGVLAGMLIGQRGTQMAMKTIHTGNERPPIIELMQLFGGNGGFHLPPGTPESVLKGILEARPLRKGDPDREDAGGEEQQEEEEGSERVLLWEVLAPVQRDQARLPQAMQPVLTEFSSRVSNMVDPVWAEILLRQLWWASLSYTSRTTTLTTHAMYSDRNPLTAATVRGQVARLADALATGRAAVGGPTGLRRAAVLAGGF